MAKINQKYRHQRTPIFCPLCKSPLKYLGEGHYRCVNCNAEVQDDFSKVKEYLFEHPQAPAYEVSQATGIDIDVITGFLREGRLEIPDGSSIYIACESCGADIRYGRYCKACGAKICKNLQTAFNPEVGEEPTHKSISGKMHFLIREEEEKPLSAMSKNKNKKQ